MNEDEKAAEKITSEVEAESETGEFPKCMQYRPDEVQQEIRQGLYIADLEKRIAALKADLNDRDEQIRVLVEALGAYAQGTSETKEWCDIDDTGCSTKWFHSVVSGAVAKEALAKFRGEK